MPSEGDDPNVAPADTPVDGDQADMAMQPVDDPNPPAMQPEADPMEDMLAEGELPDPVEQIALEPIAGANIIEDHGTWGVLDLELAECIFRTSNIGAFAQPDDFSIDRVTTDLNQHRLTIDEGSLLRAITTHITTGDNHEHEVVFEPEALQELVAGRSLVVQTRPGGSARCPHIHNVTVHACEI